jgi:hypothetical protein
MLVVVSDNSFVIVDPEINVTFRLAYLTHSLIAKFRDTILPILSNNSCVPRDNLKIACFIRSCSRLVALETGNFESVNKKLFNYRH